MISWNIFPIRFVHFFLSAGVRGFGVSEIPFVALLFIVRNYYCFVVVDFSQIYHQLLQIDLGRTVFVSFDCSVNLSVSVIVYLSLLAQPLLSSYLPYCFINNNSANRFIVSDNPT